MRLNKSFLGIGWKFPPTFDKESGSAMLISEADDIKESLELILSTRKGERVMFPDFGCNLHQLTFEAVDGNMLGQLKSMLNNAIKEYEPRITLLDVLIDTSKILDGFLIITLEYVINSSNTPGNLVFPYYTESGDVRFKPLTDS